MRGRPTGVGLVLSESSPEPIQRLQVAFGRLLGRQLIALDLRHIEDAPRRQAARTLRETFERFARQRRAQALAILLRPQLHVHLRCATTAMMAGDLAQLRRHQHALWPQLGFELERDGVLDAREWEWPGEPQFISVSPTHRTPADAYRGISETTALALVDTNPLSSQDAHPDKDGNALSLGDASATQWVTTLREALDEIASALPGLRYEIDRVVHQIVPVGTDDEVHLSASYAESVGTLYMSLHPSLVTMIEAVIHEYQHNKLNMLFSLDPLMHNAYAPLFSSPIRPDPRPLAGVMLAAHAFVPVAEFYVRRGGGEQTRRFGDIVASNAEALETLEDNADFTPVGRRLMDELLSYHRRHVQRVETDIAGATA